MWRSSVVAACLRWIRQNIAEPELIVTRTAGKGHRDKLDNHPLPALLSRPNDFWSKYDLLGAVALDAICDGNSLIWKQRAASGKVAALWWLPRYAVAPLYPADGSEWLTGWLYTVNGRQMVLPVEDVIHLKLGHVDPLEERLHESELKAAVREVCTDNEAVGFHAALLKNSGVPSVAIIPTDPTIDLSPDQAEQLGRQFRGTFSGDGAGTAFVPSAPVKLEMIGYSPDKMAIEKMVRLTESRICACIGLAPDVVNLLSGQGSRTFANYSESRVAAYHDCLIPLQKQIAEALTNQLLPDLDPLAGARRVAWDYSAVQCLAEDEDAKVVRLNGQLLAGAIMRSEYRAAFNMQATPDDEVYYLPRGVTVVTGDHTTVVQTPDMDEEEDGDGGSGGTLVPDGAGPVPVDVQESEADAGAGKSLKSAEDEQGRPFDAARRLIAAARERAGSGDPKAILHALAEIGSEHLRALAERARETPV